MKSGILLLAMLFSLPALGAQLADIDVSVESKREDRLSLRITIRNNGAAPVRVSAFDLPWRNQNSILLAAIRVDQPAKPLEYGFLIQDPPRRNFEIPVGGSITGDLDLRGRFKNIDKETADAESIVFWSYRVRSIEGQESPRFGGFLTVPLP